MYICGIILSVYNFRYIIINGLTLRMKMKQLNGHICLNHLLQVNREKDKQNPKPKSAEWLERKRERKKLNTRRDREKAKAKAGMHSVTSLSIFFFFNFIKSSSIDINIYHLLSLRLSQITFSSNWHYYYIPDIDIFIISGIYNTLVIHCHGIHSNLYIEIFHIYTLYNNPEVEALTNGSQTVMLCFCAQVYKFSPRYGHISNCER